MFLIQMALQRREIAERSQRDRRSSAPQPSARPTKGEADGHDGHSDAEAEEPEESEEEAMEDDEPHEEAYLHPNIVKHSSRICLDYAWACPLMAQLLVLPTISV